MAGSINGMGNSNNLYYTGSIVETTTGNQENDQSINRETSNDYNPDKPTLGVKEGSVTVTSEILDGSTITMENTGEQINVNGDLVTLYNIHIIKKEKITIDSDYTVEGYQDNDPDPEITETVSGKTSKIVTTNAHITSSGLKLFTDSNGNPVLENIGMPPELSDVWNFTPGKTTTTTTFNGIDQYYNQPQTVTMPDGTKIPVNTINFIPIKTVIETIKNPPTQTFETIEKSDDYQTNVIEDHINIDGSLVPITSIGTPKGIVIQNTSIDANPGTSFSVHEKTGKTINVEGQYFDLYKSVESNNETFVLNNRLANFPNTFEPGITTTTSEIKIYQDSDPEPELVAKSTTVQPENPYTETNYYVQTIDGPSENNNIEVKPSIAEPVAISTTNESESAAVTDNQKTDIVAQENNDSNSGVGCFISTLGF